MVALSQPVGICYFVVGNRQLAVSSWQLSVDSYRRRRGGAMTTCFAFAEECAVETETNMPRPFGAPNTSPKTISIESQSQSQSHSQSLSQSSQVFSRVSCLASRWKCGYFMGLQMAINLYSFYAESVSYSVNLLVNFHSQFFLTPHSPLLTHPPPIHAHSHLFILAWAFDINFQLGI